MYNAPSNELYTELVLYFYNKAEMVLILYSNLLETLCNNIAKQGAVACEWRGKNSQEYIIYTITLWNKCKNGTCAHNKEG